MSSLLLLASSTSTSSGTMAVLVLFVLRFSVVPTPRVYQSCGDSIEVTTTYHFNITSSANRGSIVLGDSLLIMLLV